MNRGDGILRRRTVLVALVAAAALLPMPRAVGVPNDVDQGCAHHHRSFSYWWRTPPPPAVRTAVAAGFAEWNVPLDYNGQRLFQWVENSSDPYAMSVGVQYADIADGSRGVAYCDANLILISDDPAFATYDVLRSVAAHEAGHIGGMEHTGDGDSHGWLSGSDDNPPLMSACVDTATAAMRDLSQEDASSVTFSHTRLAKSPLSANVGFEQGISYWGLGGGGYAYVTNGGATGPGFIRYDAGSPSGSLLQTTRWADAPGKHVVATVNHSKTAISDVGTMRVELWAREVYYGSGSTALCDSSQWPNGKNMNSASTGTWALKATTPDFTASGTGWTKASTPVWTSFSLGEQDVRIHVFENMRTYNGGVSSVRLDNVRVECNTQQSEGDCT